MSLTLPSLDPHFPTEHQRLPAATAQVASAFPDQQVALGREREIAVGAGATVDVAGHAATFDRVRVAAIGREFVYPAHDQLPFFTVGLNTFAKQLMGDQVCDFVGDSLLEKIFTVFPVQLWVEAQQILVQMGDARFLTAQLEADHRPFEGAFEKSFGLLITDFDAGIELLGHS